MEMKKVEVEMNKPLYLAQAILDIRKTLMYEFRYDYIKPKYDKDIADDVKRLFDTSNYDEKDKRPLPIGKNKKVIGFRKDELGGKIMMEFCELTAKAYAHRLNDDTKTKKAKGTKKCIVKREITFKNYVDSLFNDKVIIRSQQRFRSDHHRVSKIELSSNDDKRMQTFDKVTTFPYRTNVFKVCESEILSKNKPREHDEDKNKPKDKDKDKGKDKTSTEDKDESTPRTKTRTIPKTKTEGKTTSKTKTEDKTTSETKTKTEDKDKTTPKTKAKTEDKDKTTPKTEDKDKTKTKTKTEHKAKTKNKNNDLLDKINSKIDTINKMNKRLAKVKAKVIKYVELIYEAMCELQDEIYSDDSWLRLVELDKIDAITHEALNVVWNGICGENRISPEKIKIDKHKDIDGYVSRLTDVINNKIELVNRMSGVIEDVMCEIKNETNMIDEKNT